jgi:heat shock protein HtpX
VVRTRIAPDRGLTARMLVTMFLLGLLYVAFVAALVAVLGPRQWPLVLVVVGGFFLAQYFFSDRLALFAMRGRVVGPEEAPGLHAIVDRLCALADMPKPAVAVADSDVPNAFATGRNTKRSVVCVTTGIMRRLDRDELEGVLSHELAHVAHRDVAVMTIASFLGVLAGLVTRFGLQVGMYGGFGAHGGRSRDDRDNPYAVFLLVLLVSAVVYAVSFLLIRALSRYRELSADRAGALLVGRPSTLAAALVKISGELARIPTRDLRAVEPFNAFFFAPAVAPGMSLSSLFSTHPPLQQRLDRLAALAAQLGKG